MPQRPHSSESPDKSKLHSWAATSLLLFLFFAGLGLRLLDLTDPPLDFHVTRQLHTAIIARGMYAQMQSISGRYHWEDWTLRNGMVRPPTSQILPTES